MYAGGGGGGGSKARALSRVITVTPSRGCFGKICGMIATMIG